MNKINQPRKLDDSLKGSGHNLDKYFLGDRTIAVRPISQLLISASFGANAILYATWLGYVMGVWALLIHLAWCISFLLLSPFVHRIYKHTSLHDFLGSRFGKSTQIISAWCSVVGILYFAGWEIAIAKSGIESLVLTTNLNIGINWSVVVLAVVCIALIYTVVGGQKANSVANTIQNAIKLFLFGLVVFALMYLIYLKGELSINLFIPEFSHAILSIGIIGFITNILFNLSWQFVDNSSWQTISSSSNNLVGLKKILPRTSWGIFIAYFLGTLLGALLRFIPDLTSDNIIGALAPIFTGNVNWIFLVSIILLLLLSMMSLIDGLGLSVSQSIMIDIGFGKKISKLLRNVKGFQIARVLTVCAGIFAAWGVRLILNALGSDIFDFVYVFIVVQLSLLGAVLVGLIFPLKSKIPYMWLSIIIGLICGVGANILGGVFRVYWLLDAAGTITIFTSIAIAFLLYFFSLRNKSTFLK